MAPTTGEIVRRRLTPLAAPDPVSWVWTAVVALIAAVIRVLGLATPRGQQFDEQHYVKHAQTMLDRGIEWNVENNYPDFVVHPPLGKWCIAAGEALFGRDEFGWRIAGVVAGVAAVVVITRLGRRLFGSTVLGCAAGLLMALDGFQFVLSRFALLDIFLLAFTVGAFACLVADREHRRSRLLAGRRPHLWWRFASAALLGCALGVKWSAVFHAVAFVAMLVIWEYRGRRAARQPRPSIGRVLGAALAYTGATVTVYLGTWAGWLASDDAWDRHWLRDHGRAEWPVVGALYNLYRYHVDALTFHTGLDTGHPYQSWPMQWLLLSRPVLFASGSATGCGADQCSSVVLLLGTPVLWWSFLPALVCLTWLAISRRDWRAWAILAGALVGIVPWFAFTTRTMYYFYAAPSEPFLILAVVFVLGAVARRWRSAGPAVVGAYLGLVAVCFAYFYPVLTGTPISNAAWWARMWLGSHWV
ncbi:phospholipid carrier-dependent glycosyltransferase [Longispora sp. K20-0274]|uniref:dolichyl-phosphate-mannose--protein mannosyltransferase n=1 Tax=Longispora sp. K20-0274 TaxID=3088255 RepID=UPI00399B1098